MVVKAVEERGQARNKGIARQDVRMEQKTMQETLAPSS